MADPQTINRVQHAAIMGAACIIAYYNQTIESTIKVIAENLGVEGDAIGGYGVLGDELMSAGINTTPEAATANVMRRLNMVVDDPVPPPRDPTKPTRWSAGA